jgi:hypothetical protein
MSHAITVNDIVRRVDVDEDAPVRWVLRDVLGMSGTKFGCGLGLCGACTIHLDGVDLSRRRFLNVSAAVGGGLLIGFTTGPSIGTADAAQSVASQPFTPNAFATYLAQVAEVEVSKDGTVRGGRRSSFFSCLDARPLSRRTLRSLHRRSTRNTACCPDAVVRDPQTL